MSQATQREIELAAIALCWAKRHYDSNPEVGMRPSLLRMLDARVNAVLTESFDKYDLARIVDYAKANYKDVRGS